MTYKETLKMALSGIGANKFRTFLTLLGIIIGVAAVILMVSLGSATQLVVSGQFQSLNTRQVFLMSNYTLDYRQRIQLSLDDRNYLKEATIGTEEIVPLKNYHFRIKYDGNEVAKMVYGTIAESMVPTNVTIKYGRYLQDSDIKSREMVAVVGEEILNEIVTNESYESLIGQFIEIDGKKFIIIGIMAKTSSSIMIGSQSLVIPITTGQNLWRRWGSEVDSYLISYDNNTSEKDILSQLEYILTAKYGKTSNGKDRYILEGLQKQVNMMTTIVRVFTYLLGGIATISLLVGGIGVMNIMLVTVKERTREIGIRLAIGAARRDVQNQFLAEAVMISVGGGIIGIIVGSSLSILTNLILKRFFNWWEGIIPMWIILTAFAFTVGIGIIFGFYPAYKASRFDPIEALRYE